MSSEEPLPEAESDVASLRLAEGLKNCRAVVEDYRALIAADSVDEAEPLAADAIPALGASSDREGRREP